MGYDSYSDPDEVFEAQLADEPPPPRRRLSWAGVVMIAMIVAILVIPLLFMWIPQETARWYLAAAEEQRLDGDLSGALTSLDEAIRRYPDREELYLKRAEWRRQEGRYEAALRDVQRAIQLAPHSSEAYVLRSQLLQHLGRFDEAIADMEKLLDFSRRRWGVSRPLALNGLAYARALANQDLDRALTEIEEALGLTANNAAMLDTRGFIHYLRGDMERARADLDEAVQMIEAEHAAWARRLAGEQLGVLDKREETLNFQQHAQSVAVIRYHRSLVLDALGEEAKAEEDRERVVELGFEPGDHLF